MPKARRQTWAARLRNESQPLVSGNFINLGNKGVVRVTRGMSRISFENPSTSSANIVVRNVVRNNVTISNNIDT